MRRKATGMGVAIVLAILGTLLLVGYVQSAHDKAAASEALVDVYVVRERIPKATPAAEVEGKVERTTVPANVRAEDAVTDLAQVTDLFTTVDLVPGEQLVKARFSTAGTATRGEVPPGLLQVSVALEIEKVVGGKIRAGDTVGVLLSYEPPVLPYETHLELNKVLVTDVQFQSESGAVGASKGGPEQEGVEDAPKGMYIVSLALAAPQVEQVVHGAKHGDLWLAAQPLDSSEDGVKIVTPANVYTARVQ
jgi:pilus assembly protein CpaB